VYQAVIRDGATIYAVTDDLEGARTQLDLGIVSMLVIAPKDLRDKIESGRQANLDVETNELNPVQYGTELVLAEAMAREMNAQIIKEAATQGLARLQASGGVAPAVSPDVVASPLKADVRNRAPLEPSMLIFFAPAVLALVLQHLGVTLTALSLVRERLSGAVDIFRVAPIRAHELLIGKYVAYAILSLVIAGLLVFTTTRFLGIPFRGGVAAFGVGVVLLTFASLGLGLLISLVSDSERQAVQLSMLVLLAAVFFSGFVLPVPEFRWPFRAISYALPVTYAIEMFQQEMLRGELRDTWTQAALAALGAAFFVLATLRMRAVLRGV
jgi:ABC-2 type transport system permease protein